MAQTLEQANAFGDTALILAVKNRSLAAARVLVRAGASIHRRNELHQSAASLIEAMHHPEWTALAEDAAPGWRTLLQDLSSR